MSSEAARPTSVQHGLRQRGVLGGHLITEWIRNFVTQNGIIRSIDDLNWGEGGNGPLGFFSSQFLEIGYNKVKLIPSWLL